MSARSTVESKTLNKAINTSNNKAGVKPESVAKAKPKKLGYKEQRELEELPGKIEALEKEQIKIQDNVGDPDFYQQDKDKIANTLSRLETVEKELEHCFERWGTLEGPDE